MKKKFSINTLIPILSFLILFCVFLIATRGTLVTPQNISNIVSQAFPVIIGGTCSATSFLRNWDSILEKKRANLRSISEPARLRQPPPQKHGSGTRKRAGSKHTGGATNSRPSRAFCPLVG